MAVAAAVAVAAVGLLVPSWLLRWLMGTLYTLATAGAGLAGTMMHSE